MTVEARLPNPAFPRAARPAVRIVPARRRSTYDRWIGPVVVAGVLLFCLVMGLAGWTLVQHALNR